MPRRATFAPAIYERVNANGYFILYLIRASRALKHGKIGRPGRNSEGRTVGRACRWMRSGELFIYRPGPSAEIFTEGSGKVRIYMRIPSSPWMRRPVNTFGITKSSITIY